MTDVHLVRYRLPSISAHAELRISHNISPRTSSSEHKSPYPITIAEFIKLTLRNRIRSSKIQQVSTVRWKPASSAGLASHRVAQRVRSLNKEGHSRILYKLGRVICLDMGAGRRQTSGTKSAAPSASLKDDYFVFPDMVWIILISFGLCLLFVSIYTPHVNTQLFYVRLRTWRS